MKYIVMDWCGIDVTDTEFDTKEEAIDYAEAQWGLMSYSDQAKRDDFYVLESADPDPEADNHFDGDIIWRVER